MRISGQVMGARATVAIRRSVIFSADGCEFELTFCGSASRVSSAQKPAESAAAAAPFKNPRRDSHAPKLRARVLRALLVANRIRTSSGDAGYHKLRETIKDSLLRGAPERRASGDRSSAAEHRRL